MRQINILTLLFIVISVNAQIGANYQTPWYGLLGFHTNSAEYTSNGSTIKAPLTYLDCRAVMFRPRGFIEFGLPVASYILTGVIFRGGLPNDNGEVSFLYGKLGADIFKASIVKIGLGGSLDARLINVDGIEGYGASLESYGIISPLVYAKISLGPILLTPVFEYHILSWANTDKTKRPGFSLGAHCVVPVGKGLGININPAFEKGTFKAEQSEMESSNISFKVGLVRRLD